MTFLPNTITQVIRKGYRQGEKVLRYAEVVVARAKRVIAPLETLEVSQTDSDANGTLEVDQNEESLEEILAQEVAVEDNQISTIPLSAVELDLEEVISDQEETEVLKSAQEFPLESFEEESNLKTVINEDKVSFEEKDLQINTDSLSTNESNTKPDNGLDAGGVTEGLNLEDPLSKGLIVNADVERQGSQIHKSSVEPEALDAHLEDEPINTEEQAPAQELSVEDTNVNLVTSDEELGIEEQAELESEPSKRLPVEDHSVEPQNQSADGIEQQTETSKQTQDSFVEDVNVGMALEVSTNEQDHSHTISETVSLPEENAGDLLAEQEQVLLEELNIFKDELIGKEDFDSDNNTELLKEVSKPTFMEGSQEQ